MTWGKELQDPRLRAAVVDWAESLQRAAEERRTRHPRARRVLRLLALVWIVLAMGTLAFAVARGTGNNWSTSSSGRCCGPSRWAGWPGHRDGRSNATAARRPEPGSCAVGCVMPPLQGCRSAQNCARATGQRE